MSRHSTPAGQATSGTPVEWTHTEATKHTARVSRFEKRAEHGVNGEALSAGYPRGQREAQTWRDIVLDVPRRPCPQKREEREEPGLFRLRVPVGGILRCFSTPGVLLLLASGCATGLGAKAVRTERPDYNRQIVRSNDSELLLNLVRLRYNDSMLFLGVGGVVAQYAYDASLNAGGQAGGGTASATFGTALDYGEKPTITYTPLTGEEFAQRLLAPIPLESVMLFEHLLDLEPGRDEFVVTSFPYQRKPSEVGLRCRSLLGVLYFLSQSVEVPPEDAQAGLVTVTEDAAGRPFDWSVVTRKIMTIHSQQKRPDNAFIAVQHRGWWFYIADDDQTSKATWGLLNILFALQSASAQGKSPLLTLPIGK